MKLFELRFTLRHSFNELNHLFAIFNNMIVNGNTCKIHIEDDQNKNKYLHIEIYRCKKAFASIEINRLLNKQVEISQELLNDIEKFNNMKNVYPYFCLDESFSEITVAVLDEKYEPISIPEIEVISHEEKNDFMSLGFLLRKSFQELPDLISAANQMFENGYNMYIAVEQSPKDLTCSYLSFKIMFKTTWHPSLCINAGYSSKFNIKNKFRPDFSKWNYICSQDIKICPIWFSILETGSKQRGPLLQIHLSKPDNEEALKKIEDQCKLIFPQ